ncbi:SDR family oxidoreductase [Ramlibacter henchirensis]|uniref:SDR family oxidoreductase n=1 Tax=Ramlibacter henchirensis TaxID=204072 RepID=A0A4Z0BWR6_9BURK|nr:SDR family oxidoreductase [Ramlibacter henchirensis]TFZ02934.1 SDR family oxidoreductase [Ramlibacter henchirensis]
MTQEVAIVTGSAQGVGLGIATVYARAGALVVGCDRQAAPDSLARLSNYHHVEADLITDGAAKRIVDACVERHGRLDTLVNNAGVGNGQPFEKTTQEDFKRFHEINVTALIECCRHALPHLKRSHGSIVNISSAFGLVGAAQSAGYVPTKYAVVGITRMLATEYGRDGVRINAVAPGLIHSPGTAQRIASNAWWHRMMIEGAPLGRVGQPEEIGEACLFLSSPKAGFITGVVLPVDGGWSVAKFLPNPDFA